MIKQKAGGREAVPALSGSWALPEALRARLRSHCPYGIFENQNDDEENQMITLALVVLKGSFSDLAPSDHWTNSAFRGGDKIPE
jgi:hypothetical protein